MKVLVACAPKSGSTYLYNLIMHLPDFQPSFYVPTGGRREQEISEADLLGCSHMGKQVTQMHVRASEYTLEIIEKYDIRTVVLVRNIFDCMVSMAEHISNESPVLPMAYFDEYISGLPLSERIEAVVDLVAPWYINFYVSWWVAKRDAIATYENVILGGPDKKTELLNKLGIQVDNADLAAAEEKSRSGPIRYNVGRSGRGAHLISSKEQQKIKSLTRFYPTVDFSLIGL